MMGYPSQESRQEQEGKPMPGQLPPNQSQPSQGYGDLPSARGQYVGPSGYGQSPPQPQNYYTGYGALPNGGFSQSQGGTPNQGYGQMNQNFPQHNSGFPSGEMPTPLPMPGQNVLLNQGGQPKFPVYNSQSNFAQHSQIPNQGYGQPVPPTPASNFGNAGYHNNFNLPQQPPIQQTAQPKPIPPGSDRHISVSNLSGRKKALLIGINYYGTKAALRGCINDVKNVQNFICTYYNFSLDSMIVLTDDQTDNPSRMPTRANIIQAMQWLVSDARPHDSLFFHYSGHGSQQKDRDGDEADGYDETICPLDYASAGMIIDDDMNSIMVQPLPQGCRLTAIFDCCHSGSALDLPYTYDQHGKLISYSPVDGVRTAVVDVGKKYMMGDFFGALQTLKMTFLSFSYIQKAEEVSQATRGTQADVVMFSGCQDSQTSADAVEQGVGSTGAMSYALIKALNKNPHNLSYLQLLTEVRDTLRGKYSQIPQLSSGRPMDMNHSFNM